MSEYVYITIEKRDYAGIERSFNEGLILALHRAAGELEQKPSWRALVYKHVHERGKRWTFQFQARG